jgi:hypothetical protein
MVREALPEAISGFPGARISARTTSDWDWGFSVWSHNVTCQDVIDKVLAVVPIAQCPAANDPTLVAVAGPVATALNTGAAIGVRAANARRDAIRQLDTVHGVGPARAATIAWNLLLNIGPRHPQSENATLTPLRLDLMQLALESKTRQIVLRPNSTYRIDTTNAVYATDDRGRLLTVSFSLQSRTPGPASNTGWMGYHGGNGLGIQGDEGGHLLGRQFNGPNQYPNLVPMNGDLNAFSRMRWDGSWTGICLARPAQADSCFAAGAAQARPVPRV